VETGLVSVVVPVYNRAAMLRAAVASALAQTYRRVEVVIVDDGSTDDTPRAADELAQTHAEVRVLHQRNGGPGPARTTGQLAARGEFIQFLDSDDALLPRKFELQVAGLRAHPECGASYGWTRVMLEDGSLLANPSRRTGVPIETMFPAMLERRIWETGTPLYRASLIAKAGPWLDLRNEEDWEYDARIASQHVRLHHVPEWIAEIRHHAAERLSGRGINREALRDRAAARALILQHARRAGVPDDSREMQLFARELFLLARQAGDAGLARESKMLFNLSRDASGRGRNRIQFRAYSALTRILGWRLTGKLACMSDRLRW
jgi:glycosyltransferase involved in cell wall biosynthesis